MSSLDIQRERPSISFHRYWDAIFTVVKNEIFRAYLWLYDEPSQYVGDYLKNKPGGMKRLGAMEKEALRNKENPASFDISFLYKIIQHVCGLANDNDDMWNKPSTPEEEHSLEHTLFKLKEKRNLLSHKPQLLIHMTQDELETYLSNLRQLCSHIIREAGQKVNKPTADIDRCVAKMEKDLEDIKTKPLPSGFTAKKFALVAKQEMARKHNPSPSSRTFVFPLLHSSGRNGRYERSLKNFPLWRCDDGSLPVANVLQGDTGSGKSAITRYIYDSWVSNNNDLISDLKEFDLVIPVQCCNVSTRDLLVLLEDCMEDTISLCDRKEILSSFLGSLRILWLFDGFEEATKDAVEVLKKLQGLGVTTSPHLLFITTNANHRQNLESSVLTSKDKLCDVILSGLDEEGVIQFLSKIFYETEKDWTVCDIKTREFLKAATSYGEHILGELRVPLKLQLMVELWQDGKLMEDSGASLHHLYDAIMETHMEKIKEKLRKETKLEESEITTRVLSWMKVLWKVSFDMIMEKRFILINKYYQKKLEKEAERLLIPIVDCLSIFLQTSKDETSKIYSYSFLHGTQQIHFSGLHVTSFIKDKNKPHEALKRLFGARISTDNQQDRYIHYLILLQVVSNVAMQPNLQQSTATVLVDLLSLCPQFNIFDVVQYADYSQTMTKAVSKVNLNQWIVYDKHLKATNALLQFTAPTKMSIDISNDPKGLQELPEILIIVKGKDIEVSLRIWHHNHMRNSASSRLASEDSSDRYLTPIFSSDAKCHLSEFIGNLSFEGIQYLLKMKDVELLYLKVFHQYNVK